MIGMNMPTVDAMKTQAKRLRADLETQGTHVSHAQALEMVAHQHGHRDWNTAHAASGNRSHAGFTVGHALTGTYLGQKFSGELIAIQKMGNAGLLKLTIQFDKPVDVVTFESFSSLRHRVTVTVDRNGITSARTSNGEPHMQIDM